MGETRRGSQYLYEYAFERHARTVIVTTLSNVRVHVYICTYFPMTSAHGRESRTVSSLVESGSVGITDRNSEPRSLEGSPGRYYVKVVADEETLGETATHLPACQAASAISFFPLDCADSICTASRRESTMSRVILLAL